MKIATPTELRQHRENWLEAECLYKAERSKVISHILDTMARHEISFADLHFGPGFRRARTKGGNLQASAA